MRLRKTQSMFDSILKKIKNSETENRPTYKDMYEKLANSADDDEIHRIVNKFIFEWFPKEKELDQTN